ncbi:hypothetical protein [Pseudonocardia sp. DLS-67]
MRPTAASSARRPTGCGLFGAEVGTPDPGSGAGHDGVGGGPEHRDVGSRREQCGERRGQPPRIRRAEARLERRTELRGGGPVGRPLGQAGGDHLAQRSVHPVQVGWIVDDAAQQHHARARSSTRHSAYCAAAALLMQ